MCVSCSSVYINLLTSPIMVTDVLLSAIITVSMFVSVDALCPCAHRLPVLLEFYTATSGHAWTNPQWDVNNTDAPCGWVGVTCDNGDVTGLQVSSKGLNGTLPASLANLTALYLFDVETNLLTGTLPPSYAHLTNLLEFLAGSNRLSGNLPDEYSSMRKLKVFNIDNNTFTGTLPRSYGNWSYMEGFRAFNNMLSGSLPTEYQSWTSLAVFSAFNNSLTGTLPEEYASWGGSLLETFNVFNNHITGTLPPQYSAWSKITFFNVCNNSITGSLPAQYASWSLLKVMYAHFNQLNGTLPDLYRQWQRIESIAFASNQLTGTIPNSWGGTAMPSLSILLLGNNFFSGTIPQAVTSFSAGALSVRFNNFSGTLPTVFGPLLTLVDIQDNEHLGGSLPSSFQFGTVSTCRVPNFVCPSKMPMLVSSVCVPRAAMDRISQASITALEIFTLFTQYPFNCTGATTPVPPSATTKAPTATHPSRAAASTSPSALATTPAATSLYVVIALSGGNGVGSSFGGGTIPSLQRATNALRLSHLCINKQQQTVSDTSGAPSSPTGEEEETPAFADIIDNPLLLSLPVSFSPSILAQSAAGAVVGNTVLLVGFGLLSHGLGRAARLWHKSALRTHEHRLSKIVDMLVMVSPTGLLPGSFGAVYSSLLQPTVASSIVLIGHATGRSGGSIAMGVILGVLVWSSVGLYFVFHICWVWVPDGILHCELVSAAPGRRKHHREPKGAAEAWASRAVSVYTRWMTATTEVWTMRARSPSTSAASTRRAIFVEQRLSPLFEAYVEERRWFFAVEWAIAAAGGVINGAALIVAELPDSSGDSPGAQACAAAVWGMWIGLCLTLIELMALLALRPFRARVELAVGLAVSVSTAVSGALTLSGDDDAAGALVLVGSVIQLASMFAMLVHGLATRKVRFGAAATQQQSSETPPLVLAAVVVGNHKSRPKRTGTRNLVVATQHNHDLPLHPQLPVKVMTTSSSSSITDHQRQSLQHLIALIVRRQRGDDAKS